MYNFINNEVETKTKYYGKYKATVVNNKDPLYLGRIKVECPSVLGEYESEWCMPCVPIAFDYGGLFYVPSVGEPIWVEFEEGDIDCPIYTGGVWLPSQTPLGASNDTDKLITFVSRCGNYLEFNDKDQTITISSNDGSYIKLGGNKDVEINSCTNIIKVHGEITQF